MSERCKYERHDKSFDRHVRQLKAQKQIDFATGMKWRNLPPDDEGNTPMVWEHAPEPVKLIITLDGGLITDISTCGIPVDVVVIDYDVECTPDYVRVPGALVESDTDDHAHISRWLDPNNGSPTSEGFRGRMLALHDWATEVLRRLA